MDGAKTISYKQLFIDLHEITAARVTNKTLWCLFESFALLYAENPLLNTDY